MADTVICYRDGALQLERWAPPTPRAGEVRYHVSAFALNRSELLFMDDRHYVPRRDGVRLGYEACGVVDAIGPGVTGFAVGDRVSSIPFASDAYGVNGSWAVTPAEWLAPWPASLDAAEGCSAWMQYLTAYFPLFELTPVEPGDVVLVSAASSSAAIGACQLVRSRGAHVIGLTRRSTKSAGLRAIGYDAVIATEEIEDLARAIRDAAGGRPVRLSYDAVCGDLVARYASALAPGATIYAYGNLSGDPEVRLPLIAGVRGDLRLHAYSTPNFSHDPVQRARAVAVIAPMLASGRLRPVIDQRFAFADWRDAYVRLRSGEQVGKVVVTL